MSQADQFNQAQAVIPGGVNSPVRAFKGVGGDPVLSIKLREPIFGIQMASAILIMWVPGAR